MKPSSDGLPSLISCFLIQAIKNPPVEEQEFDPAGLFIQQPIEEEIFGLVDFLEDLPDVNNQFFISRNSKSRDGFLIT